VLFGAVGTQHEAAATAEDYRGDPENSPFERTMLVLRMNRPHCGGRFRERQKI